MSKRIAILQSNYIPWRGYFDIIGLVDEFVLLDNVQYTKNDWRNRNRIPNGGDGIWLTIPVRTADKAIQNIDEAMISDPRWARKHWLTLSQTYARAPHFAHYESVFAELYRRAADEPMLATVNRIFIDGVCAILGITTPISQAEAVDTGDPTERVVQLCRSRGATRYLSGPSARDYVQTGAFDRAGVTLEYMDYSGYAPYRQRHQPFDPAVSILDLLFNEGPDAARFMSFGAARTSEAASA
ncbi:MAG: WbqC family protein [Hyphomonadaceae bacterium]